MLSELSRMWVRLSQSRNLPTINALINIGRTVGVLLIVFLGFLFADSQGDTPPNKTIYVVVVGVVTSIVAVTGLWYLWGAAARAHRRSQYNPDIWVRERHQLCDVITKKDHRLFYNLTIEFLSENVASFLLYIEWTGDREIKFELENADFSYTSTQNPGSRMVLYRIVFDYPRNRGEKLNLRYNVTGHSADEEESDFLFHTFTDAKVPEKASLAVRFRGRFSVVGADWQSFSPPNAHRPADAPENLQLDASRTVRKEFTPKANTKYVITWRYAK